MGQYKVPQDVEAEDKIIGPLTLKQFIYAVIGVAWGGISWVLFKGVPVAFVIVGLPPALLFLLLGLYRRQDQPFEVYLLAVVTYFAKPRKRLWEKEPIEEVFKVNAPQVRAEIATRDPQEVISQLDRLAHIVDTRGYSTKQPEFQEPTLVSPAAVDDRLAQPNTASPAAPVDIDMADDILDFKNNPSAQSLDALIADSTKNIRQEALQKMKASPAAIPPTGAVPTYIPGTTAPLPAQAANVSTPPVTPAPAANNPVSTTATMPSNVSGMTQNPLADILKLAMESSDLTVSQIATQASRQQPLAEGQTVNLRNPN